MGLSFFEFCLSLLELFKMCLRFVGKNRLICLFVFYCVNVLFKIWRKNKCGRKRRLDKYRFYITNPHSYPRMGGSMVLFPAPLVCGMAIES